MNIYRRAEIESIAKKVQDLSKISYPLINPSELVLFLNGILEYSSDLPHGASGMIQKYQDEKKEKQFIIYINENEVATRQRFTIAHELGHLILHMGYLIDNVKWTTNSEYLDSGYLRYGYSEEEYEANHFAGNILMPKQVFKDTCIKYRNEKNMVDLSKVADEFGLSIDAIRTRGRWLGVFKWN